MLIALFHWLSLLNIQNKMKLDLKFFYNVVLFQGLVYIPPLNRSLCLQCELSVIPLDLM